MSVAAIVGVVGGEGPCWLIKERVDWFGLRIEEGEGVGSVEVG